jgi:hypothetical protein
VPPAPQPPLPPHWGCGCRWPCRGGGGREAEAGSCGPGMAGAPLPPRPAPPAPARRGGEERAKLPQHPGPLPRLHPGRAAIWALGAKGDLFRGIPGPRWTPEPRWHSLNRERPPPWPQQEKKKKN